MGAIYHPFIFRNRTKFVLYRSFLRNLDDPAEQIFTIAILNSRQRIIEILRQLADLAAGNGNLAILPSKATHRRDDSRRAGAERLFQRAVIRRVKDILHRNAALVHGDSLVLGQLDDGVAGDAAENRTEQRRRDQRILELEEHVHRTDFLDVLVLLAIQPKHLLIALFLRDVACKDRRGVVARSLGKAHAAADGADILRLWAASADYHADVRCSKEIFKQLSQNYLKFRNTCKFMLDNLVDFDPEKLTKPEDMPVLDRWLLTKLNELIEKAEQSYCDYEFHIITHAVNDFCVNTLSSFYLDIVKDRLYCEGAESATRRSAQTALYLTLHTLSKLFAPILAFTCDEIWLAMPHTGDDDARNVVLNEMNKPFTAYALDSETMARWEHIIAVRTVVNGALEEARAAKVIGKSLEADVHLTVPESDRFFADESPEALADIFIVSKVELAIGDALAVKVDNAAGTKCPRCWKHSLEANAEGLCPRCAEVVKHLHLTELL